MSRNIMLDIETLGSKPGCVVLAVATVEFDATTHLLHYSEVIHIGSCLRHLLLVDPITLKWWTEQDKELQHEMFSGEVFLEDVLFDLNKFFGETGKEAIVWCKGMNFDFPILHEAYDRVQLPIPWHYRNIRDSRTLTAASELKFEKPAGAHDPYNDCVAQIKDLQRACDELGIIL